MLDIPKFSKYFFCFFATLAWTVGVFITMFAYLLVKSAKLSGYQTVKTNYPSYYQEKNVLNTAKMFEGSAGTFCTPESAVNWNSGSSFLHFVITWAKLLWTPFPIQITQLCSNLSKVIGQLCQPLPQPLPFIRGGLVILSVNF